MSFFLKPSTPTVGPRFVIRPTEEEFVKCEAICRCPPPNPPSSQPLVLPTPSSSQPLVRPTGPPLHPRPTNPSSFQPLLLPIPRPLINPSSSQPSSSQPSSYQPSSSHPLVPPSPHPPNPSSFQCPNPSSSQPLVLPTPRHHASLLKYLLQAALTDTVRKLEAEFTEFRTDVRDENVKLERKYDRLLEEIQLLAGVV